MLSFDEFRFALTEGHQDPHWKNAYVDRVGNYWIQGNGGLGTTIFQRLLKHLPSIPPVTDPPLAVFYVAKSLLRRKYMMINNWSEYPVHKT